MSFFAKCLALQNKDPLKGVCHELFYLHFLWFKSFRAPEKRAEVLLHSFLFPQDIRIFKKLRGVHLTVESISAVCITPLSQSLQCASHRQVRIFRTNQNRFRMLIMGLDGFESWKKGGRKSFDTLPLNNLWRNFQIMTEDIHYSSYRKYGTKSATLVLQ